MIPSGTTNAAGARTVFSTRARWALLGLFALLVACRLPQAWAHGRFLGEEGTIFFAFAWHRPALEALLRSFGGYLNIGANGTALLSARLVQSGVLSLEHAPYLTMLLALSFQLLPAVLLLTGRARWLADGRVVIACLAILVLTPMIEEVFLNILHIQFSLAMCAALILALDVPAGRGARIGYGALLVAGPLCGPGAILLFPFFALRALHDRERGRAVQAGCLALGIAIQLLLFFQPSPVRGEMLDPATLAAILFVRLEALPYLTPSLANKLGRLIYRSQAAHGIGWWAAAVAAIAYFGALVALAWRDRRDAALWLIVPALAVAAVSFSGGMIASDPADWFSTGAGQRYNYLPLVMITLGLVVLAARPEARFRKVLIGMIGLTLLLGTVYYFKPLKELREGPDWSREVAEWRGDHDHPLAAWPADWTVDLSDRDRPCAPRADGAVATDPSYCESHWLAFVAEKVRAAKAETVREEAARAARRAKRALEERRETAR